MRWLILLVLLLAGCNETITIDFGGNTPVYTSYDYPPFVEERPTVNLEQVFREKNYLGPQREGSCVHCAVIDMLRWQNHFDKADYWRRTYSDGEWAEQLAAKLDAEGYRFAYTVGQNDVSFLEWALSTRRGCGITVHGGSHMILLVYLDGEQAGLLDCNFPEVIKWVPRETFLAEWENSNSWAVALIYSPPPPRPCS